MTTIITEEALRPLQAINLSETLVDMQFLSSLTCQRVELNKSVSGTTNRLVTNNNPPEPIRLLIGTHDNPVLLGKAIFDERGCYESNIPVVKILAMANISNIDKWIKCIEDELASRINEESYTECQFAKVARTVLKDRTPRALEISAYLPLDIDSRVVFYKDNMPTTFISAQEGNIPCSCIMDLEATRQDPINYSFKLIIERVYM